MNVTAVALRGRNRGTGDGKRRNSHCKQDKRGVEESLADAGGEHVEKRSRELLDSEGKVAVG